MLVALFSVTVHSSSTSEAAKPCRQFLDKGVRQSRSGQNTITMGIARYGQTQGPPQFYTPKHAASELVTPPETATVETWYTAGGKFFVNGPYGSQDFTGAVPTVKVAIDGADIYIQGLGFYFQDAWIKGTISGTTASFANGQYIGEDSYGAEYLCGTDDREAMVENIVFDYDATEGILKSTTIYILENSTTTKIDPFCYWVKPIFSKAQPEGMTTVVPPAGMVADEWAIVYKNNMDVESSGSMHIGFDGNNIYLQGICSHIPDAWIKGKVNGTTITFPGQQYLGFYQDSPYSGYDMYLQEDDLVFTYDAEANKMTAVTAEITIYTSTLLKGDIYKNAVITKVVEKAVTPATPNISQIYDSSDGPVILFTIPTLDVNGDGIATSKLSFQFLKDVEEEISPVTFAPADYKTLTEPMTVFPYGFTDNNVLFPTYIYLKQGDYSTWNKIGLQTIYTGGGEENKSEIYWLTIKEYNKAIFNFNAMTGEPCSSNVSQDGDITEDRTFTAKGVSLTVSPSTTSTPNRLWSTVNGPQLRVYGGTLTFEAPVGKVIKKMVFNNSKWNAANSANTGSFVDNVWTGEAQKVVVTIGGNTQLNSIEVYPTDYIPTAVEVPENLVTETYIFKANSEKPYYDPAELTLWVNVGFDGNDVYIQGLAADYNSSTSELWVKATKNEAGQYVIPANQFMGSVSFWMSNIDCYFTAVDAENNMIDAVLDFDAEKSQFTTSQTLVLNALMTELYPYQTFTNVVITKFNEVAATPATPTIKSIDFGEWSHGINCDIPTVGTNGETLNPKKLFYTVWVEKEGQQTPYTFLADMYWNFDEDMSEVPYEINYNSWDGSHGIYFNDDATVCDAWEKVGIQSIYYGAGECKKSAFDWIENPNSPVGISDITAKKNAGKAVFFNIAGQRLNAPQKGLNIVNGRKVLKK